MGVADIAGGIKSIYGDLSTTIDNIMGLDSNSLSLTDD